MTKSTKRIISLAISLPIIGLGIFGMLYMMSLKEPPPKRSSAQGVREVTVSNVYPQSIPVSINLQGRLIAVETVPLFSEVTGVFQSSAKPFKLGVFYRKGELLASIDGTESRYSLLAQKAGFANLLAQAMPELKIDYSATFPAWDAYLKDFDPEQPLPELPPVANSAARYFLNGKNIFTRFYEIKAAEERLSKFELYAPVSGTLTEVSATVGALIRQGQPLGTLTANNYELAATVPVADLEYLKPGTKAALSGPSGKTYQATVNRVSTQIDPATQTATLYLSVQGEGLKEGLYLTGRAEGERVEDVIAVDQRLLVGTDEVYVVIDSTLARQTIEIVRRGDKQLFVRGLEAGTTILAEAVPGAYEGMRVKPNFRGSEPGAPVAKSND